MKAVTREEFQKRKELSLPKERSLRNVLQEFEYFLVSWIESDIFLPRSNHCYPSQDLDIVLDFFFNLKQAFDEHFAEDKRFLAELQKALEQMPNVFKGDVLKKADGSYDWEGTSIKQEAKLLLFKKWSENFKELFSGFQGTFYRKASLKTEKGQ